MSVFLFLFFLFFRTQRARRFWEVECGSQARVERASWEACVPPLARRGSSFDPPARGRTARQQPAAARSPLPPVTAHRARQGASESRGVIRRRGPRRRRWLRKPGWSLPTKGRRSKKEERGRRRKREGKPSLEPSELIMMPSSFSFSFSFSSLSL